MDNQYKPGHLVKKFLEQTSQFESSGGINTNHRTIRDPASAQYGDTAVGQYGLMPNTVREQINRLANKGYLDPELSDLNKMSDDELNLTLQTNPQIQQRFAEEIAKKLYLDTSGDTEKMHYMWNMGTNIPPEKITPDKLDQSVQVKKFRNIRKVVKK